MKKGLFGDNLGAIALIAVPLLLLLNKKEGLKLNLPAGSGVSNKSQLIENIKPYFSFQEQTTLNKVQDILEIINRFTNIQSSNYENQSNSMLQEIPNEDKKEKILTELSRHLEGKSKEVADNLVETTKRVKQTKSNLNKHKQLVSSQEDGKKVDKMLNLFNSLEPIMHEKGKKKIRKIEKVLEVIKKPEEEF